MQKIENPELSRLMLTHLSDLYNIKKKREGIHLSTLVYCITRSFFDHQAPVEPTDEEVMLFSLGFGLQDVLTPKKTETPVYEKDGITFSPDFVFPLEGRLVEIKTTRMSSSRTEFPETWLEYIKGGCYMQGINEYELAVLHMLGNYKPPFPRIESYKLIFEEGELNENWDYLMERKAIYTVAIDTNKPPAPYIFCKDWECKNCRYKLQCEAIRMVAERGANLSTDAQDQPSYLDIPDEEEPEPTCPLCGKPSEDGKEHQECMDREAALADRPEAKKEE